MFGLRVDRGDASSERSIVLESQNLVLLGGGISIVMPIVVPFLVSVFTSLVVPISIRCCLA